MTMLMQQCLGVHREGAVLTLLFNRAESRNAFNNALLQRLDEELVAAYGDHSVRCIILEGAGGAAFSAGIDLVERRSLSVSQMGEQSRAVLGLVKRVACSSIPVIAAIDGWCLGAGLELAMACDIRIATRTSRFGFPEMMLGTYPGGGGAVMLPRVVGQAKALEILLLADRLDAEQARHSGMLTFVVESGELAEAVKQCAAKIAALSPSALRALKASIRKTAAMPLEEAFDLDQSLRRPLDGGDNYQEGLRAFAEKRPPRFTGD